MYRSKTTSLAMLTIAIVIYFLAAPVADANHPGRDTRDSHRTSLGETAPEFSLPGVAGKERSLADFKGKYVVLEWVNFDCPLAGKHYNSNEMQAIQKTLREQGVVWLSVCSATRGEEGYSSGNDLRLLLANQKSQAADYLIDDDGRVARLYGVEVVPTLFLIAPDGKLVYTVSPGGTLYDTESENASKKDYMTLALEAHRAGDKPAHSDQVAYGCSIAENRVIGSTLFDDTSVD